MAPLRMLAWQTQQRLLPCTLITGQEKQIMISGLTSCTIETLDMGAEYDVAVIDEIQLISDFTRGWAWTQALLGVKAKELHLCGENRALGLIHKIVKYTVDNLEERRYTRFSKLHLIHKPFNIETDLLPGDCLIVFSTMSVYKMRTQINKIYSGRNENKVAVVYGKLPPECRKVQANLFNDGTLPYLVATNAIGMGLNLKIRRIIFMEL
jgi:ATP-dependent RNA helicase SUPV3L1/SUV3